MKKGIIFVKISIMALLLSGVIVYAEGMDKMHKAGSSDKKEMKMVEEKKDALKVYVCPMDEHKNIVYANQGNCPLCGMKMVEKEVEKVFICPMEEHQDKMYLEKGKCPECGMKLIVSNKIPEKEKEKKLKKKEHNPEHKMMDMDEDM